MEAYYRFEYIHRPKSEPVWDMAETVELLGPGAAGVEYDITSLISQQPQEGERAGGARALFQTAFTF